jgi:hypothetical protein
MQPNPSADTSRLLLPNVRFCIAVFLLLERRKVGSGAWRPGQMRRMGSTGTDRRRLVQAAVPEPGRRGDYRVALENSVITEQEID